MSSLDFGIPLLDVTLMAQPLGIDLTIRVSTAMGAVGSASLVVASHAHSFGVVALMSMWTRCYPHQRSTLFNLKQIHNSYVRNLL